MRRATLLAASALLVPALAACSSVHEAIDGPKMGPMAYPAPLIGQTQPEFASAREPAPAPVTPNSLWRTGARTFFNDQRAGRVGDILTVLITINDSAQVSNATTRERKVAFPRSQTLASQVHRNEGRRTRRVECNTGALKPEREGDPTRGRVKRGARG